MKRNKTLKKAFTLVEMLIVVVIIGILAAALLPRLTGAQAGARDAARKTALNQLVSALGGYYSEHATYPNGTCINDIEGDIAPRFIKSIPRDPQQERITYGTKNGWCGSGYFAYTPMYRQGQAGGWMVIIANTERDGKNSNWILRKTNYTQQLSFGSGGTEDADIGDDDYYFVNADAAETNKCESVTYEKGKDNSLKNCITGNNPAMVYVVFN